MDHGYNQQTLGELLKAKIDCNLPNHPVSCGFTFPKRIPDAPPPIDVPQLHFDQPMFAIVNAIKFFRMATGSSLAEAKWSFDDNFTNKGINAISLREMSAWTYAYYQLYGKRD